VSHEGLLVLDLGEHVGLAKDQQVLAVGDGRFDEDGDKRIPLDVSKGDTVLYSKYGGTEIKVDGEDLLVLRESDVLAKVQS
jgi:chaperonin GroES